MKNKLLMHSLLATPAVMAGLMVAVPQSAHAAYLATADPRFAGINSDIGTVKTVSKEYSFHHGTIDNTLTGGDYPVGWHGGYWAGSTKLTMSYKIVSMNKLVVLAGKESAYTYDNSATNTGGGFYDTNFIAKFGYKSWISDGVRQPEKRSDYNYADKLLTYIDDNAVHGVWYGAFHLNSSLSFTKNSTYYYSTSGVDNDYAVYADANGKFIPFTAVNRIFVWDDGDETAHWNATPLNSVQLPTPNVKYINNTTTVTHGDVFTGSTSSTNIAPSGTYTINDAHDSDKKMLSWSTGDQDNKYFTTGDKVIFRSMSPIIQADAASYGQDKNDGMTKFYSNQVFRQSIWVPDGFDYKSGAAKVYAIQTDGSRIDVTSRFNIGFGSTSKDTISNYSETGTTSVNMRRLVASAKSITDTTKGGYNNANTVGYSFMVPVTVNATAHTDLPYVIKGGSQIINGVWHATGSDVIHVWRPSTPASTPTTSNATVFNNDSNTDFGENSLFYETNTYANNKTFRTNESDGYYTWHSINASAAVPTTVSSNKGAGSSIAPWATTQPLVFTIPYDNRYVTPIGVNIVRWVGSTKTTFPQNTNSITATDTGSSYVVTIPSTLLNTNRTSIQKWGVALKYKVKSGIPGNGVKISSSIKSTDEISGSQTASTVYNYLESPNNSFTFDTLDSTSVNKPVVKFTTGSNNTVHFVNGQRFGYDTMFDNIAKVSGSNGVGEPLSKLALTAAVKANQVAESVDVYKGNTQVWRGKINANGTITGSSTATLNGWTTAQWANMFTGSLTTSDGNLSHALTLGVTKTITVKASNTLLNDKTGLYNADDLSIVVNSRDDVSSNQTNLTTTYDNSGTALSATLTGSISDLASTTATLSQRVSRVKPGAMVVKHNQWPATLNDNASGINLNSSTIQARETFDYRLTQFLGNSGLKTEAYATPMEMRVSYSSIATPTGVSNITVKAYDTAGNITDVTGDFTISIANNKVIATMKDTAVKAVTGKAGSVYNKLYVLNVPMKNQTDTSTTVKNGIDGSVTINGQLTNAPYISEFIPPETPYMYGYSATNTADAFDPTNPEKDKGKIAYGKTSDGTVTSAQISTAPVEWVLREQLGDMSSPKVPQKYAYSQFTATFADVPLFANSSTMVWHVYDETGRNVTSLFKGAKTSGTGYKITASASFLTDMDNYGHKYYFVIRQTTQNNHANRLSMAIKAGLTNVYSAFKNLTSSMKAFYGSIGIGNTTKSVASQNFDMQYDFNILQINSTKSGLNEKMSELNVNPYTNGKYTIQNVALSRPLAGYDITGATAQFVTNGREYESYTTAFTSNGATNEQAVRAGSVKIIDSQTNKDVTSQYTVTVSDQKVVLVASKTALDRLTSYHKTSDPTASVQDTVTFHVDTWGNRTSDTVATWYATHTINGYNDAQSTEKVTIPKAHAGHKEIYVSPAGQNKWQSTDYTLPTISQKVDLKIRVTVPNDMHNVNFTDFIAHYIGSEITPFLTQSDATATIKIGENSDYAVGSVMTTTTTGINTKALNSSRATFTIPDSIVTQLNTTDLINNSPTYTVIIHNISFQPTTDRKVTQYVPYLTTANRVYIPVGGVTMTNGATYFQGKNGSISSEPTIGTLGTGSTLGAHSGKINIILPEATAAQEGYINGGESNTSFTGKAAE